MSRYTPAEIEPRWQQYWAEHKTFAAQEDPNKPKYYALCMFPYPSGSGLHMGHPLSYTAIDIVARLKRMQGYAVLNPMGWDAFGLAAERTAVREGRHPADITKENVRYFRQQAQKLGYSFDWDREVDTSSIDYYKHTQWIFLKLYEKGLAYLAEVPVNWCPAQGTVLANEEVQDGKFIETGDPVERRMMKQWMLKITAYAERLIDDLEGLDWPHGVLEMQRKWIGRSEGAEVTFRIADQKDRALQVFTTRPDTLFGATYCVIAPEHPLVGALTTDAQRAEVEAYVAVARNRSDMERQVAADKEKTGVHSGSYAINPVTGERIPIWIADYVLMGYGTGAIMAVPAHDERDHAFAKKFGLEIRQVIRPSVAWDVAEAAWTDDGVAMNSGRYDGLSVPAFKKAVTDWLEAEGLGTRRVNYKLRDWLFSRQRYWGEPFPIVHAEDGRVIALDPQDLPVGLPDLADYRPTPDGQPPLARVPEWVHTTYKGERVTRELNTMPQWAGSCWYYLRFMDPHNEHLPWDPDKERYWGPVDLYIGGVEHAVLHLLYARFWHKVLYDCGLVHTKEPFQRLFNQGMLLNTSYRDAQGRYYYPHEVEQRGETSYARGTDLPLQVEVEKMGKSKKNGVDPLEIAGQYGADVLRVYVMFMGPLEQVKPWQTNGCEGALRFLSRVWRLFVHEETGETRPFGTTSREVKRALHVAIREASEIPETLKFNTPVSKMMEFVNACKGETPDRETCEAFVLVLSLYAPHLAETLWERLGHEQTLAYHPFPTWDAAAIATDEVEIAVQVLGKLRGTLSMAPDASKDALIAAAKAHPGVAKWLEGKEIVKEIVVPGRLVNFVVR